MTAKPRVLSGMRPTGKLHLGNYLGALEHWVRMQDDYDCYFFVASWHALTTDAHNSGQAPESTIEMAADWLGAGLDPQLLEAVWVACQFNATVRLVDTFGLRDLNQLADGTLPAATGARPG